MGNLLCIAPQPTATVAVTHGEGGFRLPGRIATQVPRVTVEYSGSPNNHWGVWLADGCELLVSQATTHDHSHGKPNQTLSSTIRDNDATKGLWNASVPYKALTAPSDRVTATSTSPDVAHMNHTCKLERYHRKREQGSNNRKQHCKTDGETICSLSIPRIAQQRLRHRNGHPIVTF
jgi:hypothetical protein